MNNYCALSSHIIALRDCLLFFSDVFTLLKLFSICILCVGVGVTWMHVELRGHHSGIKPSTMWTLGIERRLAGCRLGGRCLPYWASCWPGLMSVQGPDRNCARERHCLLLVMATAFCPIYHLSIRQIFTFVSHKNNHFWVLRDSRFYIQTEHLFSLLKSVVILRMQICPNCYWLE